MAFYTREQLRDLIRQRTSTENDDSQTDAEINNHINDGLRALHDLLISVAGDNYSYAIHELTTVAGQSEYSLAAVTDFGKLIRVGLIEDNIEYPLRRYNYTGVIKHPAGIAAAWDLAQLPKYHIHLAKDGTWDITFEPTPDSERTLKIHYHTTPLLLTDDAQEVTTEFYDYVIAEACLRIRDKNDRDRTVFERERAAIRERIENWGAQFDQASTFGTIDVHEGYRFPVWRLI